MSSFAQGTQQRVINTTSAFARQILTNETAAEWAAQILLGTNFNFGNFALLNGTNTWTGTNTFSAPFYALNSTNMFGGNGLALLIAAANIQAGTVSNAVSLTNAANVVSGVGTGLTALTPANLSAGTVSNAISMTNTANNFVGSFTGNGAGLTNISGGGGGSPSGPAGGDLTNTYPNPQVFIVGGVGAAAVATGANAANAATSLNTPGTIVKRDGSGNIAAGAISGTSFSGNGAGLSNINIAGGSLSLSNWYAKIGFFISNAPPLAVNDALVNGLVTGKLGSQLLTNLSGSWTWTDNLGNIVPFHLGDQIVVSNSATPTDQHRILYFVSSSVVFTFEPSVANYPAPGVNAFTIPNYLTISDTVPRDVGFVSDDGAIGIGGGGIGNSGGFLVGGLTNWWLTRDFDDTSGYGYTIKNSSLSGVVFEIYTNAPNHALDVMPTGTVVAKRGFGSKAVNTPVAITATGITNSWTNNGSAWVTGGAFTNFDNAGTATLTNVNTVTNFLVPLQPNGSIKAASGLSGIVNPW